MVITFLNATTHEIVAKVSTENDISWEAANAIAEIIAHDLQCEIVIDSEDA